MESSSEIKIEDDGSVTTRQLTTRIMASVTTFKSAITRIRDILRGPGVSITGMDSMRHICLYLLSRYMTKEKVASLGVPDEFAWETLMETALTKNGGVQKALDCFYHAEEDCLVRHFDRLFGTDKFSFDIKNPQKHKEILEILNAVNMTEVDCQMDILGWVYEQHLKTGSSSAGRDLGQFFTDRFICEYMTELCAPGFKRPGVPESVCDPSMGTGGFLSSFIKYYKKHHADQPIDWAVQQKEIHGNDTDPRVAGVARLNLFMETGGSCSSNLLTHDSLYGDLTQTGYDVILANMPFGLKGIKHADCCERVKELKIRGTKSEPLFLQLMMVSLNRGGRCAVVVPDGMLVNSSGCHDGTRKYLLDHFELKRVIKMRGQFFMNTGIQPSILFFENTGNPTTAVEFWDVVKGANGFIEETMVLSVPRERFDASCSLDMRRYQEVKEVANSAGYPMVKLSEACDVSKGKRCLVSVESGGYPYQDVAHISRMVEKYIVDTPVVLTPRAMSIGRFVYTEEKCHPSDDMFILKPKDNLNAKYLYYYCMLNLATTFKDSLHGVKPTIDYSVFDYTNIIVPPLPIQQEIVATLDRIYQPGTAELAETLKLTNQAMDLVLAQPNGATLDPIVEAQRLMRKSAQMVADVKAQMVADVKAQMVAIVKASLLSTHSIPAKLGDILTHFKTGKNQNDLIEGDYPFYMANGVSKSYTTFQFDGEYVLNGRCGSKLGDSCYYVNGKFSASDFTYVLQANPDKMLNRFLYYYIKYVVDWNKYKSGTSMPNLPRGAVTDLDIRIPSLNLQYATLARLNALQSQLTALETLQKQSEDNARFILESYLDSSNVPTSPSYVDESKEEAEWNGVSSMPASNEIIQPLDQGVAIETAATATTTTSTSAGVEETNKKRRVIKSKKVKSSDSTHM
jgi:restriction endonuclease S subunit